MEAIEQIMFALNCTEHTSGQDTDMTQKFGSVAVYTGARDNCERVEVSLVMRG
jgi:endonuclease IV